MSIYTVKISLLLCRIDLFACKIGLAVNRKLQAKVDELANLLGVNIEN